MPNLEMLQSKIEEKRKTSIVEILAKHQENVGVMVQQIIANFSKDVDLKLKEYEKILDDKIAKTINESLEKYSKEEHSRIEEAIKISLENYMKKYHSNIENVIRLNLEKFAKEEHSIIEKTICEYLTKFEISIKERILTFEKKIENIESTNRRLLLMQIESCEKMLINLKNMANINQLNSSNNECENNTDSSYDVD